jgi:diketogulonate reductase-like aldo/keto reductase
MVQLHWEPPLQQQQQPGSSSRGQSVQGFVTAAKALQQLQQRGLLGAIGVSNFDQRMLMALLDAGVKPVSNQVGPRDV